MDKDPLPTERLLFFVTAGLVLGLALGRGLGAEVLRVTGAAAAVLVAAGALWWRTPRIRRRALDRAHRALRLGRWRLRCLLRGTHPASPILRRVAKVTGAVTLALALVMGSLVAEGAGIRWIHRYQTRGLCTLGEGHTEWVEPQRRRPRHQVHRSLRTFAEQGATE